MTENSLRNASKQFKLKDLKFFYIEDKRMTIAIGCFFILFAIFMFFSLISHIFVGDSDQSSIESGVFSSESEINNWFGALGALISYFFLFQTFGITTFSIIPLFFLIGWRILFHSSLFSLKKWLRFSLFIVLWFSTLMGYAVLLSEKENDMKILCGILGFRLAYWFNELIGWGTILMLLLTLVIFLLYTIEYTTYVLLKDGILNFFKKIPYLAKPKDKHEQMEILKKQ